MYIPDEEWQIDFAGDALYLTDAKTGEITKVVVLVCVMPYSELLFLMAIPNATTEWFFLGLNKGLEYMGALPSIAKSDNMKQWVSKSDRYSPQLSDACMEWANHYGIGCTACRVRKLRDKEPVESAVNQLDKYIYARIQDGKKSPRWPRCLRKCTASAIARRLSSVRHTTCASALNATSTVCLTPMSARSSQMPLWIV